MKKILSFFIVLSFLTLSSLSLSSCTKKVVVVKKPAPAPQKAPPGQVKKTTGSQSAAPYAPGQQKNATSSPQKKKN